MDVAPPLDFDDLPGLFPELPEPGRWLPLLQRHGALLQEAAPAVRVTSVAPGDFPRRHYAECLELLRAVRGRGAGGPVIDLGSGGGFPGLVFAAIEPETAIHLVEPLRKRARLLSTMVSELGFANVRVHAGRAEDLARGPLRDSAVVVTARAVAELRVLLEYAAPFAAAGGALVFPKGSGVAYEITGARAALRTLRCRLESSTPMRAAVSETLTVVVVSKTGATPTKYPRRAGTPERDPL